MPVRTPKSKAPIWITFIGLILVLIGLYATARTAINLVAFEKYPQGGVLPANFSGVPQYFSQERDCNYVQTYFTADGKTTREPKAKEKEDEKKQQQNCLEGVKDSLSQAKINDISQSLLFLFLGLGVLASRKIFFK